MAAPELEDLYDEDTLAALERAGSRSSSAGAGGVRRHAAAGAIVLGLTFGLQDAFEPPRNTPVVIEVDLP